MTKELDAGNVIYQASLSLSNRETYRTLYNKLSGLAYQTLRNKIKDLFKPNIKSVEQDVTKVTFARNITRLDEKIN
jgi:methionyl-tRNA formyltransferase